ncbi:molybdopterin-guanine dinucleotide biosynthesis protein A [Desulfitobacterium dichloroeliminans LMG P-21439]|uniref:Probable molybdenum cofactor guanylyltransferase n=1 Tax=Desulfitobacterium dichloroeliminans (strain LMG P-21439 / DCA1) TaxID=871963 RepID=L0F6W4_DESDL|nr:molybdenum cofactor guanylyltransferase [Desulfitobacterium dichloroeliminans]AGA68698.1 molybdopterin-guanine dinucleotide biosynthesis protein A [Desulfitobacterium dichloroeliminans LMG P-21439]
MGAIVSQTLLPMTGIILAGGKSSRMGCNKAFIEWDGVPLIERSLAIFHRVFSEVVISSNHPELYANYDVQVIKDNYPNQGPLGGLEACLRVAHYDYTFFAACDMPLLNSDVIRFMAEEIDGKDILAPEIAGGFYPLHAYYHKSCLTVFEKQLLAHRLSLRDIFRLCSVHYLTEEDFKDFPEIQRYLSSVNTPQECLALRKQQLQ